MQKSLFFFLLSLCLSLTAIGQDSLITVMAREHLKTFAPVENQLQGEGWEQLLAAAKTTNYVLIGEDHFLSEIPFFTSQIAENIAFDNYICEIDPFTADLLEDKKRNLSSADYHIFVQKFSETFSFHALAEELALLNQMVDSGANIIGTDQVIKIADRLLFSDLSEQTKNPTARAIYDSISLQSKTYFDRFAADPKQDFFLETEEFSNYLQQLSNLKLSPKEEAVIAATQQTLTIYKEKSHRLRIQLMKEQLMDTYPEWRNKKNLFKFGAVHSAKRESLLKIYDIGNLVNNLADAEYDHSLHIMIVGKAGTQATPFEFFPPHPLDSTKGYLSPLAPFFEAMEGKDWHCFDLRPLAKAIDKKELTAAHSLVERAIKGYDFLVIIPEVTAATFGE